MGWYFIVSSWWLWYFVWFSAVLAFFTSKKITNGISDWMGRMEMAMARFRKRRTRAGYLLSAAIGGLLCFGVSLLLLFTTPVTMMVCFLSFIMRR